MKNHKYNMSEESLDESGTRKDAGGFGLICAGICIIGGFCAIVGGAITGIIQAFF